jgi:hypothetical protein
MLVVVERREDHYARPARAPLQLARRRDPVHAGHADVD